VVNTADVGPLDGETFAVNYEGEFVVKRMVRESGSWWLASDNQDSRRFPRKLCDESTFILGRIVHAQTENV
jgi:phage repressor protein C with HTH and peptisase S24 domain